MARSILLVSIAPGISIQGTLPQVTLGVAYSATLTAQGGASKYTFTKTGALPSGLTFTDNGNGTATIAGTTSAAGNYPVTVTLTSNTRQVVSTSYMLVVPPITLQLLQASPVKRGVAVTGLSLKANGGNGSYTYSCSGLPAGLTLNTATGAITGTVTAAVNTYTLTASVHDSVPNTANLTVPLIVNSRLSWVNSTPGPCEDNYPYSYTFSISGATGAVTYSVTAGTLPGGTTLSTAGVLSGSPFDFANPPPYTASFTVTASDAGTGESIAIACSVTRNNTLQFPFI